MEKMNYQVRAFALNKLFESVLESGKICRKFFKNLDKGSDIGEADYDQPLQADVVVGSCAGISYMEFVHKVIETNSDYSHMEDFMMIWNGIHPDSIKMLNDEGWQPLTVYLESRKGHEYTFKLIVKNCASEEEVLKSITWTRGNKNFALPLEGPNLFENEIYEFVNQTENMNI